MSPSSLPLTCQTFTLALIRSILTVKLAVAAQAQVDALPTVALKLRIGADRTVVLVAFVVAFGVTVAPPRLWDAVHLTGRTGELLRRTGGRFCRSNKDAESKSSDQN